MKKILVISPHFDDAVLSAGQYLAERPDADVVTVYGGIPLTPDRVLTPYDEKCGFDNARNAVGARTRENDQALALLLAKPINLELPDSQYQRGDVNAVYEEDIRKQLQEIIDNNRYEFIMAPLGLGHPDHLKVTEAVLKLKVDVPVYLWEDIPLRVVEPETVPPRLNKLGLTLDKLWQPNTTDDKIATKIRSMTCYRSQINTGILDPYVMYVPERFWRIK